MGTPRASASCAGARAPAPRRAHLAGAARELVTKARAVLPVVAASMLLLAAAGCTVRAGGAAYAPALRPAPPPPMPPPPTTAPPPSLPRPPDLASAPDPEARRLLLRMGARPPAPLAAASRPPRVVLRGLEATARGEVTGMTTVGPALIAALREGERAALPVTLEPGECDAFVAQGGLGVVEVDLFLTRGRGEALRVLGEDPTSGPVAVLGGRGACIRNDAATPLAADLVVQLRRGTGVVVVRRYRR